jgi:hypothetical protein
MEEDTSARMTCTLVGAALAPSSHGAGAPAPAVEPAQPAALASAAALAPPLAPKPGPAPSPAPAPAPKPPRLLAKTDAGDSRGVPPNSWMTTAGPGEVAATTSPALHAAAMSTALIPSVNQDCAIHTNDMDSVGLFLKESNGSQSSSARSFGNA